MASSTTEERGSIRDRYRSQVQDEVKQVALRQLAEGGPAAVSVNAIAKELGLSGPALYRYFPSRDALLTALVLDAYDDFAAELGEATATRRELAPLERLRTFVTAYRGWAKAQPYRYHLLYREPLPGYPAQATELVAAARELMVVAVEVIDGLGRAATPTMTSDRASDATSNPDELGLRGVTFWARLHGLVDLELNGNYASMHIDPAVLYEYEITQLVSGH